MRGPAVAAAATPAGRVRSRAATRPPGPVLRVTVLASAFIATAAAAAAIAADAGGLDDVLALLAARRHGHVTFTEVHTVAILDRPLESSGELLYDAPDRLEKRTLKPKPETLILEHGVLSARRGHRTFVLSLREFPQVVPFVESIRATLAGDRSGLERYFALTFSGDVARWSLTLVPSDATVARTVKEIRIEGERDLIHTVSITQADGDASVLAIGPDVGP